MQLRLNLVVNVKIVEVMATNTEIFLMMKSPSVEPMARPAISAKDLIILRPFVTQNLLDRRMIQKVKLKIVQWLFYIMWTWTKANKSEKSLNSMEPSHLFNPDEDSFNICILINISINLCQNQ